LNSGRRRRERLQGCAEVGSWLSGLGLSSRWRRHAFVRGRGILLTQGRSGGGERGTVQPCLQHDTRVSVVVVGGRSAGGRALGNSSVAIRPVPSRSVTGYPRRAGWPHRSPRDLRYGLSCRAEYKPRPKIDSLGLSDAPQGLNAIQLLVSPVNCGAGANGAGFGGGCGR
jgi:hypothetical protein